MSGTTIKCHAVKCQIIPMPADEHIRGRRLNFDGYSLCVYSGCLYCVSLNTGDEEPSLHFDSCFRVNNINTSSLQCQSWGEGYQ